MDWRLPSNISGFADTVEDEELQLGFGDAPAQPYYQPFGYSAQPSLANAVYERPNGDGARASSMKVAYLGSQFPIDSPQPFAVPPNIVPSASTNNFFQHFHQIEPDLSIRQAGVSRAFFPSNIPLAVQPAPGFENYSGLRYDVYTGAWEPTQGHSLRAGAHEVPGHYQWFPAQKLEDQSRTAHARPAPPPPSLPPPLDEFDGIQASATESSKLRPGPYPLSKGLGLESKTDGHGLPQRPVARGRRPLSSIQETITTTATTSSFRKIVARATTPATGSNQWTAVTLPSNSTNGYTTSGGSPEEELRPERGPVFSQNHVLPKRARKKRSSQVNRSATQNIRECVIVSQPDKRHSNRSEARREQIRKTRADVACIRCRGQRQECRPNKSHPDYPNVPCIDCTRLSPYIAIPCLRWTITNALIYRAQKRPWHVFITRLTNMDLVDFKDWASTTVKEITVSQTFLDAPYELKVRQFIPHKGDRLEKTWKVGTTTFKHPVPPYAIANMQSTADYLKSFIEKSVRKYLDAGLASKHPLIKMTFEYASKQAVHAKTEEERRLLTDVILLWVASLKTSNPEHICGQEKLGGGVVCDPRSRFYNRAPVPPIIIAQMECIIYTCILIPTSRRILQGLREMAVESKQRERYWLTIYLTIFVLLQICSTVTRRDMETARNYDLTDTYANRESIKELHVGANIMLAHFHYLNKGNLPFTMTETKNDRETLEKIGELDGHQIQFVRWTWQQVRKARQEYLSSVSYYGEDVANDFYWLFQLFEEKWEPKPST